MPESVYGQRDSLGVLDKTLYINISDQVKKYPSYRRELIKRLNGKNFGKDEVKSYKYEWSARGNRPLATTLKWNIAADATSLVAVDAGVFNVDDVFQMTNGTQYRVTSVAGGVNVNFTRIPESGEQAAATEGDRLIIVSGGTPHGKDADSMVSTGFDDYYNFTGNFEDVVDLSDLQHNALIRGEENSGELISRKQMELTEKLQRALAVGVRAKDSANKITYMGGLKNMIDLYAPSTHVIDFGGSSVWTASTADRDVQDKIDDALDLIAEKAFEKPVIWVSPAFMKKFKHVQSDRAYTTVGASDKRGIGVVKKYDSHTFGLIDVVQLQGMDHLMDDYFFIVDESTIGYKAHRGLDWHTYPLAKTGQSFRWQVAGHFTFKMDIPESAVYFHNLGV